MVPKSKKKTLYKNIIKFVDSPEEPNHGKFFQRLSMNTVLCVDSIWYDNNCQKLNRLSTNIEYLQMQHNLFLHYLLRGPLDDRLCCQVIVTLVWTLDYIANVWAVSCTHHSGSLVTVLLGDQTGSGWSAIYIYGRNLWVCILCQNGVTFSWTLEPYLRHYWTDHIKTEMFPISEIVSRVKICHRFASVRFWGPP